MAHFRSAWKPITRLTRSEIRLEEAKVRTMLVIGARDKQAGAVSVRIHGKGNLGAKPKAEVIADILAAIRERRV